MTMRNAFEDLATDKGLTLLRRIFQALKPLSMVTGGGSNRLSVDVNSGTVIATQATAANLNVTAAQATAGNLNCTAVIASGTVTTVGTVSNQTSMGGVSAFEMMKALSRQAYNGGVRARIT